MECVDLDEELKSIVEEIRFAVDKVYIHDDDSSRFTVKIQEGVEFKLYLDCSGFHVEGQSTVTGIPDNKSLKGQCYETIYAFLDNASPAYRKSFANDLSNKLSKLQQ